MKHFLQIIVLIGLLISSFLIGTKYGSYNTSKNLENKYLLAFYSLVANDIIDHVQLIKHIKYNQLSQATNIMERKLDISLADLATYVNKKPKFPDNDIIDAIKTAKKYRSASSNHAINPRIKKSVNMTLDYVK